MDIRLNQRWTEIDNPEKKAHEKEHAAAWLDRVFGKTATKTRAFDVVSPTQVYLRLDSEAPQLVELPAPRIGLLRSLWRHARQLGTRKDWTSGDGAAIVFTDEARSAFLLTRKDDLHPNPKCRGRYALVSGNVEKGEHFRGGALRELYEEVTDMAIADATALDMQDLGVMDLEGVQWPGTYRLGVFEVEAPAETFEVWKQAWQTPGILSEANPVIVTASELYDLLEAEKAEPGSRFVASHGKVLERVVNLQKG